MTGTRPPTRAPFGSEGHILYTLLDAAVTEGLVSDAAQQLRWREIEARVKGRGRYYDEADAMHAMLSELDATNALAGTWIEERWRSVKRRTTQPPF